MANLMGGQTGKIGRTHLLALGLFAVCLVFWLTPADVWAGLATDRLDDVFEELQDFAQKAAWGILGIGVIVIGVKLSNGDPDTKQRSWQFLFASVIVYMAGDILEWLQN